MTSPAAGRVMLLACGSFNPITNMHLRMFELGRDFLNGTGRYLVVGGIVSPVNDAYGKKDLAPAAHRCAMVQLAINNTPWLRLDTWESEQDRWIETVKLLGHHYRVINSHLDGNHVLPAVPTKTKLTDQQTANSTDVQNKNNTVDGHLELKLLCGADLLESFAVPGLWRDEDILEIVSRFGIVVVTRCGSSPEKFIYESDILSKYRSNINVVTEWIPNEICSTSIRRSLRRGQSVRYLLQDSVIKYIHQHKLYGVSDSIPTSGSVSSGHTKAVGSKDVTDISKKNLTGLRSLFTQSTEEIEERDGGYRSGATRGRSAPRLLTAKHLSRGLTSQSETCSVRSHSTELRPISTEVQKAVNVRGRGGRWQKGREEAPSAGRSCIRAAANPVTRIPEHCAGRGGWVDDSDSHSRKPHFSYHYDDRGHRHGRDSNLRSKDCSAARRESDKGINTESHREVTVFKESVNEPQRKCDFETAREAEAGCHGFAFDQDRRSSSGHSSNISGAMQRGGLLAVRRGAAVKVSSLGLHGKDVGMRSHTAEVMQYAVRDELIRLRPETCV